MKRKSTHDESWIVEANDIPIKQDIEEIAILTEEIQRLQEKKQFLLNAATSLIEARNNLRKRFPHAEFEDLRVPAELRLMPDTKIGDAAEAILVERGSMTRKELLEVLRRAGIPLSAGNGRVVLFNALTRDKKNRFAVSKDGRVALRKESKK